MISITGGLQAMYNSNMREKTPLELEQELSQAKCRIRDLLKSETEYKLAIENGKLFCIKDENSAIYKHGCVSCRTLSKDVQNLEPYFGNFTDKKIAIKTQALENSNGN